MIISFMLCYYFFFFFLSSLLILSRLLLYTPLFPYTTLFRSLGLDVGRAAHRLDAGADRELRVAGHDGAGGLCDRLEAGAAQDRKSTRLNSSHLVISYAVFCLKKKTNHVY